MVTDDDSNFFAKGIYGANTNQPLVDLTLNGQQMIITVEKAREMAHILWTVAESAVQDGMLYQWAMAHGFGETAAAMLIVTLRNYRHKTGD